MPIPETARATSAHSGWQAVHRERQTLGDGAGRREVLDAHPVAEHRARPELTALGVGLGRLVELHITVGIEPRKAALRDAAARVALRGPVDGQLGAGRETDALEVEPHTEGVGGDHLRRPQLLAVRQVVPVAVADGDLEVAADGVAQDLDPRLPSAESVLAEQRLGIHRLKADRRHIGEVDAHGFRGGGPHRLEGLPEAGSGDAHRLGGGAVVVDDRRLRPAIGAESEERTETDSQQQPGHLAAPGSEESIHADLLFEVLQGAGRRKPLDRRAEGGVTLLALPLRSSILPRGYMSSLGGDGSLNSPRRTRATINRCYSYSL